MKNQTLLFLSILFCTLSIYSQAPRGFYAFAGFDQTELKSSDLLTDPNLGFLLGLNFQMGYHETYNYQLELTYRSNSMNVKYVENDFNEAKDSKFNASSLNLGLYFNYYILKPEEDEFFIGPQVGVFAAFHDAFTPARGADVTGQYYLPHLLDESDLTNSSKFNYGFGAGLTGGYNNFRFDLRYSLGMANLLSDIETDSYDETHTYTGPALEGKTNTLIFGISYNIFHPKK
ncbi:outer membrane beta-barrel protein [Flavobacterium sp. DGU38]|uniref:Outer membrane beta-barrel protein n=1 Tax=Flavobacterium calami TaxID=3139144 RepID=A0ABU9IT50_9FLAO